MICFSNLHYIYPFGGCAPATYVFVLAQSLRLDMHYVCALYICVFIHMYIMYLYTYFQCVCVCVCVGRCAPRYGLHTFYQNYFWLRQHCFLQLSNNILFWFLRLPSSQINYQNQLQCLHFYLLGGLYYHRLKQINEVNASKVY